LPNPILRPAIELITGIKVGPARSPLSPITEEEYRVMKDTLKAIGKI
jgi:4-hydroxy-tetrahydrodipicolinate synthase